MSGIGNLGKCPTNHFDSRTHTVKGSELATSPASRPSAFIGPVNTGIRASLHTLCCHVLKGLEGEGGGGERPNVEAAFSVVFQAQQFFDLQTRASLFRYPPPYYFRPRRPPPIFLRL